MTRSFNFIATFIIFFLALVPVLSFAQTPVEERNLNVDVTLQNEEKGSSLSIEGVSDGGNISVIIDGEEVDIDPRAISELAGSGLSFARSMMWFILVMAIIGLALFVFWLAMLIHAIGKKIKLKALWIIILLVFGILGAVVYYFAVKRDFDTKHAKK
jgi:magnesium-transporting ATPase (P-type)